VKTDLKFIIGLIIVLACIVWFSNIRPSANENDITVEGVLELNYTGICDYKEYLLNIKFIKDKDCHIAVYPYISGLGLISFNDADKIKYFIPGSIGSDGVTESIAIQALENKNLVEHGNDDSLIGFWFPDEAGQYEARIYLDKLENSIKIKNPVLILVYHETKFGKQFTWSKVVPITHK
jgi:hypothetical protein